MPTITPARRCVISNLRFEISEIPHRGVEPRLTASNVVVRPSHSQGHSEGSRRKSDCRNLPSAFCDRPSDQCSTKESNLVSRFRRPRCDHHTRRAFLIQNVLARSRTWSATFGGSNAVRHTPRTISNFKSEISNSPKALPRNRTPFRCLQDSHVTITPAGQR